MDSLRDRTVRLFATPDVTYWGKFADPHMRGQPASVATKEVGPGSIMGGLEEASELQIVPPSSAFFRQLVLTLGHYKTEWIALVLLDEAGVFIASKIINGTERSKMRGCYRSIVSFALANGASSIVVAHNHPSGSVMPSAADRLFTRNLSALLHPVEISLADHIIVSDKEAFSMNVAGLL